MGASGDVRAEMCERRCASGDAFLTRRWANGDGFNAVFAVFCAVFRRGELGCTSGDVLTGMVLTQCLQGSAQCFAGASWDVLAGMCL